jgi:hypothetical protein
MAWWMLGLNEHQAGNHEAARRHLEEALATDDDADRLLQIRNFGHDRRIDGLGVLSNVLWIQGHTAEALETSGMAVAEARGLEYPVPLCIALSWHCFNHYVIGAEWSEVELQGRRLAEHAQRYGVEAYQGFGVCLQALSGKPDTGAGEIASSVANGTKMLARGQYTTFNPIFRAEAAMALAAAGLPVHAEALLAAMIQEGCNPDHWCGPEIVRIKGEIALGHSRTEEAESLFRKSMEWAVRQGALAWQLRSANSLASLWINQGRQELVADLLRPLLVQFKSGIVSRDLQKARLLLKSSGQPPSSDQPIGLPDMT